MNPSLRSALAKTFALASSGSISSTTGSGQCLFSATSSLWRPRHTLSLPFSFMAATRPETHTVSLSSFVSTPRLSRRSSSSLSLPFTAMGTQRGGIITGVTILSTSKWGLPSILPRPLKYYAMRDYHMQGYYNFIPPTKRYTTISFTKYLMSSVSRDF